MRQSSTNSRVATHLAQRVYLRGAASIEALAALPVFILLFVSVLYVRDQAVTKQDVEMRARTCAWLYSANNCSDVPAGCEGVVREASGSGGPIGDVGEALTDAQKTIQNQGFGGAIATIVGRLIAPALEEAFGRSLDVHVEDKIARPRLYWEDKDVPETNTLTGRYHLPCNLRPTTSKDVALEAWKILHP